jgi:hypothetical protein
VLSIFSNLMQISSLICDSGILLTLYLLAFGDLDALPLADSPKGSKSLIENGEGELDKAAVFRHWYDLARELGYCSGQQIREGEQWICLSGAWEKWEEAVSRGYSLEYLKKIMKRNQGR